MKLPGFSAEESLYGTEDFHRTAANPVHRIGPRSILPQISVMEAVGCEFICIPNRYGAGNYCFWFCPGHIPYLTHPTEELQ